MNDFFSKLENFFFDILGLILPGVIFLLILLSPVLFVDMDKMEKVAGTSALLSALVTVWDILKTYWSSHPKAVLTIATIIAYLTGHTIKVFSRIKYEFLIALFDDCIDKGASWIYGRVSRLFRWVPQFLRPLFRFFKKLISNIFTFKTENTFQDNLTIQEKTWKELNKRLDMQFPNDDYTIGKFSSVVTNQEALRSLGTFFLAKYNLYRSLALIFLFTSIYYFCFFKTANTLLSPISREISVVILWSPIILWYTFHDKYKRYWGLYGGERLLTLFYFLNRKNIKGEEDPKVKNVNAG